MDIEKIKANIAARKAGEIQEEKTELIGSTRVPEGYARRNRRKLVRARKKAEQSIGKDFRVKLKCGGYVQGVITDCKIAGLHDGWLLWGVEITTESGHKHHGTFTRLPR